MATYKEKAIRLTVLSIGVGAMFIASFALYAHPDFANAQSNNKTSILPPGVQAHREYRIQQQIITLG